MWLERLIEIKKSSGKTTDEISQASGIPKGTLNKLFSGQTKDPQLSTIKTVVHSLGFTMDDLDRDAPIIQTVQLTDGIIAALTSIYGAVEDKEVESDKSDWTSHYYLVGRPPNTFILYDGDIEAIADSFKASIPFLVDRMKDNRPEEIVKQECIEELNALSSQKK